MRLLLKEEVDKGKKIEEELAKKRLASVNEELANKERILNTVTDGMPAEKEMIVKEFDRFRKDIAGKRSKLTSEIAALKERKNILDTEDIRKNASQSVLDEQEDMLIEEKQKLEKYAKEVAEKLKQEREMLEKAKKGQLEQVRMINDRSLVIGKEERILKRKEKDLKENEISFENQKRKEEKVIEEERIKLDEQKTKIHIENSSNNATKELISKEWKNIERTKIKLKDGRATLDSAWSELKYKQNGTG